MSHGGKPPSVYMNEIRKICRNFGHSELLRRSINPRLAKIVVAALVPFCDIEWQDEPQLAFVGLMGVLNRHPDLLDERANFAPRRTQGTMSAFDTIEWVARTRR